MTRRQLRAIGYSRKAIDHRIRAGRLHPVHAGVYAVGRRELSQLGQWMAAVLACGRGAALSNRSAAALWRMQPPHAGDIHVVVPASRTVDRPGIRTHREKHLDVTTHLGIPVTTPLATLVALAPDEPPDRLEAAINEADKLDLIDPETLRAELDRTPKRPGTGVLKRTLDIRTFTLTDSELERRFRPIARRAGLSKPVTGAWVNGHRVDFFWPSLGLVVETDGLRYHRTAAQQTADRVRDQAHTASGLVPLRFTRAQVRYDPDHVEAVLKAVVKRLLSR